MNHTWQRLTNHIIIDLGVSCIIHTEREKKNNLTNFYWTPNHRMQQKKIQKPLMDNYDAYFTTERKVEIWMLTCWRKCTFKLVNPNLTQQIRTPQYKICTSIAYNASISCSANKVSPQYLTLFKVNNHQKGKHSNCCWPFNQLLSEK